jgi:hypothetical protein
MERARRAAPSVWAVVLALLLLGPALGPGYVLSYDMVWVPDLALRSDLTGLGTALPRAVPSDAVVAVLDEVVPGMLLQKLVLLGALVLGGVGIQRIAGPSLTARLVAVSGYVWTPFVVERLGLGHWPVLLGWAVLPWLVEQGARLREDGRLGAALPWLLLVGSLSASAGLVSALVVLAVGLSRRSAPRLVAAVLAANAPWLVAGVVHAGTAVSSEAGSVFGVHREGPLPAPLSVLTLGGAWNAEVVPASRDAVVMPLVLAVVLVLAACVGAPLLHRRLGARTTGALVAAWAVGFTVAIFSWAAPSTIGGLAAHVPGGGLVRDGSRWLALCAPLTALLLASGADWLAGRWRELAPRVLVTAAGVLLPLAAMPDVAWGLDGGLAPASYPADWAAARQSLDAADRPDGDLLVLPFSAYRGPTWNDGRKVLDPLGRYLQPDYLADDALVVDGRTIAGEDPRVPRAADALALATPAERSTALRRLGIRWVARALDTPATDVTSPELAGEQVYAGPDLEITRLTDPVDVRRPPGSWVAAMVVAWSAYLLLALVGVWNVFSGGWSRMRIRRRTG